MVIGIDPGFSGAICFYSSPDVMKIYDLPLKQYMNRTQIDAEAFAKLIKQTARQIDFAVIEDVHAMPGQGVTSMFRFGYNAGILLGVLCALNIKVLRLKPAAWKSALGLGRDKKASLALAIKYFPKYRDDFKRARDDGRAEAALLAHFAFDSFQP